ncbi:hypothetical protein Pint_32567 [Pistacia integerrima]|nr:hypothetical protein Pint_32567 [Pistacia integerrima]
MENLWRAATGQDPNPDDYNGIEFWATTSKPGAAAGSFSNKASSYGSKTLPTSPVPPRHVASSPSAPA